MSGALSKDDAVAEAISKSRAQPGERFYAVYWEPNPNFPDGHWTIETSKPCLAGCCLLAVNGKLEHA